MAISIKISQLGGRLNNQRVDPQIKKAGMNRGKETCLKIPRVAGQKKLEGKLLLIGIPVGSLNFLSKQLGGAEQIFLSSSGNRSAIQFDDFDTVRKHTDVEIRVGRSSSLDNHASAKIACVGATNSRSSTMIKHISA